MKPVELRDTQTAKALRDAAKAEGETPEAMLTRLTRKALGLDDLTVKDVCRILGCHRNTFYTLNAQGAFPNAYYRNSRVLRIPQRDVDNYRRNGVVRIKRAA